MPFFPPPDESRRKKLAELQRTFKLVRAAMLFHPLAMSAVMLPMALIAELRTQFFTYVLGGVMIGAATLIAAMLFSVTASHRRDTGTKRRSSTARMSSRGSKRLEGGGGVGFSG